MKGIERIDYQPDQGNAYRSSALKPNDWVNIKGAETVNEVADEEISDVEAQMEYILNEFDTSTSFLKVGPAGELVKKYLRDYNIGIHHVEVYDNWIKNTLPNNITIKFLTLSDGSGRVIRFEDPVVFPPRYYRDGKGLYLTPKLAREQGITYGSDIHVNVVLKENADPNSAELDRRENVCIGSIPCMLKSINCILRDKSPRELALLGENPRDPPGYFIISGVEKVIQMQEQLAVNKIFLMNMTTKGSTVVRMTANTARGTALIELALDKSKSLIRLRFPSLRGPKKAKQSSKQKEVSYRSVNVLRIFRLLGIESVAEIKDYIAKFIKKEHVEKSLFKLTRNLVDFEIRKDDRANMLKKMIKSNVTDAERDIEIDRVLNTDLFPHLNKLPGPDSELEHQRKRRIELAKLNLLSIMIARFLEFLAGFRQVDNRDSWSNKRVEGARLMEQLLRNAWRRSVQITQGIIDSENIKDLTSVVDKIRYNVITDTFHDSFITSKWGVKGTQLKNNVAQTLSRDSIATTFAHITTIDVGISRTDRQTSIRLVQNSQWGLVCPISVSEGENCGLLKNMCITAKVSLERYDDFIIRSMIGDKDKGMDSFVTLNYDPNDPWQDKLIVNGKFLGWCDGEKTKKFLIEGRRSAEFPNDMSVIKEDDWLYVDIGPSRLIRPLLIVNDEQELVIDKLNLRNAHIYEMFTQGAMEYMSSWEQEYIKIATTPQHITNRLNKLNELIEKVNIAKLNLLNVTKGEEIQDNTGQVLTIELANNLVKEAEEDLKKFTDLNKPYTHCEVDTQCILSVVAATIPWPNHNQAPRNTYQASMGKQALGIYHPNHENRMGDGKTKILPFSTQPIVTTEMYDIIGLNEAGPGDTAITCFSAYPFTEEDAFVVKKEFLENGGFRIVKYLTYKTVVKHQGESIEELARPERKVGESVDRYKYIQYMGPDNPVNGLPMIGAPLRPGDCVIGKIQIKRGSRDIKNESVLMRAGDEGVVDRILVTTDNKTTVVIVKLRTMRVPQEGDKFAPRCAQKGTIGLVVPEMDLPKTENGIAPDFIVNSSCFTSDTPFLMKNGIAKPLKALKYNGGDDMWTWHPKDFGFVKSTTMGYESKGIRDVVKLTFSDGRTIKCTPEHKFPVVVEKGPLMLHMNVRADEITDQMLLMASMDGVLDDPTPEEREIEMKWSLETTEFNFHMKTDSAREEALAFSRLLGLICTDGCIYEDATSRIGGSIVTGSVLDVDSILDDLYLITGKRPSVRDHESKMGKTKDIRLPMSFARSIASLEGMTVGRRTNKVPEWPYFVFKEECPKSIIREFLGGVFGGDGWSPYLTTNKQDGPGTVTFNPPALSQSTIPEQSDEITEKMQDIANLLEKVGVHGARVDKPKTYVTLNGNDMLTCVLQLPRGTEFGDKVGFRYCVDKMHRMAVYQSYMRYLENVKRQNDFVVQRTSQLMDEKKVRLVVDGLEIARKELLAVENPLNPYYSYATRDQVNNRRRKDRHKELLKWDYEFIEDAEKYLRKIRAYHWFDKEKYIIDVNETKTPCFYLRLNDRRYCGREEVFDVGVHETHMLTPKGLAALNCLPSRMTIEYLMEIMATKHASFRGTYINGGAFKPFNLKEIRETLVTYSKKIYGTTDPKTLKAREFGYEILYSGTSGKKMEALMFMGPVYWQALKHHVLDKTQARASGVLKAMTRQPPKGRGNKGGLRFGEMERDATISHGASAFTRERLMLVSDGYQTVFCRDCGTFAVNNPTKEGTYQKCKLCGNPDRFGRYTIPYAYKLLIHLLGGLGINLRLKFLTSEEYLEKLLTEPKAIKEVTETDITLELDKETAGEEEQEEEQQEEERETNTADIYD